MRFRSMAVCTALLLFSEGLPGSPLSSQAQAQDRVVDVLVVQTGMQFGVVDGVQVPTHVAGDVLDLLGKRIGAYEEMWNPVFDANGVFVGMNGVALFNFNGADPTLNGTLTSSNATVIEGYDDTGFFLVLSTMGQVTDATGGFAGLTGDVAMASTALLWPDLNYFDSQVMLSLRAQTGGGGGDGTDGGGTDGGGTDGGGTDGGGTDGGGTDGPGNPKGRAVRKHGQRDQAHSRQQRGGRDFGRSHKKKK